MVQTLEVGATHTLDVLVTDANTAAHLAENGETLPPVFATPFMLAAMERACAAILSTTLEDGDVSVGAKIDVSHVAPSPVGVEVLTTARFTDREGPLYWFDVSAKDPGGLIGKGRIARAILSMDNLMARAEVRR
ncbi:Fluoroacetyl-CoA thioesterase [Labrenzia sp. THAF82]|uniref:thioesterase family protein n=1 Tax=Labrenzia sp. THAF82 TaxID=2587861 RepID=UPI001268F962|nr:thioesterase [Labrenzia sp. THAF82]QFT34223.1 Fluoroacetyl-CoA thioesterase [Labrenzia sp. THAF82]